MNYEQWLRQAALQLIESDSPKRDAEILLGHVTQRARTYLMAFNETLLSQDELTQLSQLLTRRIKGEPIAYLVGEREFWSLPLKVSPATLIPRPDTECLVEQALEKLPTEPITILDLGTGTGAIALAMASERPDCHIIGVDFQAEAVALAQENATRLALNNTEFMESCWFSSLSGYQFGMIISNPPYIDENDEHIHQGDVRFEPLTALVAGNNGFADIEIIIETARQFLTDKGWVLLEHGWQQGEGVRKIFTDKGYCCVETFRDYGGNERVTVGRWNYDRNHS
ncbi:MULTISPECIES: peptide chain release factor N(5)-glutamine methyltransferase [Proteus]|uniref:Release factor glutamine methyltransferase n=1 Tax=Proteus penneri TaxID=102862 RepID=A0A0G4QB14_9GAMM|nr:MULTISPECIES: peptide chain release factor N(5)-glutamine methyltransferase [Proteus]EEG82996.1 protein-(glutamine-N5) methyltransferase, release factor-specific [Proteus penneri ATCC 35198]MBJ2116617.1 peptide chain release factor N(5)-glutamine methyltransferase [Proteus penneri]MCO8050908.1 peptide chain release factor N(5)-glutamine methyltransferase [Proteus penneri]MCX2588380.1 peptide chain release factor N(5)-glutamine methyltransferase [Proteus penneri]NBL77988.1 peptide chain rele